MVWESESSNSKLAEYQKHITLIEDRLSVGAGKTEVAKQLEELGLNPGEASGLVEKVARRLETTDTSQNTSVAERARTNRIQTRKPEKSSSKITVLLAAFAAALVGGFLWQILVTVTGYEMGFFAWGIGLLVGSVVMMVGQGEDNVVLPFISATAALFGVMFGKYLTFIHFFNQMLTEMNQQASVDGAENTELAMEFSSIGIFNGLPLFMELGMEFGMYEFLWVFLSVSTAWGMATYDS